MPFVDIAFAWKLTWVAKVPVTLTGPEIFKAGESKVTVKDAFVWGVDLPSGLAVMYYQPKLLANVLREIQLGVIVGHTEKLG